MKLSGRQRGAPLLEGQEVPISVSPGTDCEVVVFCACGTEVVIGAGREKRFILRQSRLHLLDCHCALCSPPLPSG